jgi:Transposase, Mutator family
VTERSSTPSSTGTPFRLPPSGSPAERELAEKLVEQARAEGVDLVGPGGLLGDLTKRVLEAGLEAEMTDHVGYERHDPAGRTSGNSRNGTRTKTVITDVGPVELAVPRDRDGRFEPKLVAKRLRGVDEMVISLTAKGLTTGEVQAHLAEVYGTEVSRETVSKITDRILEEMTEWMTRPLERVYPVVFIDALFVKIRDGQVTNRPIYTAIGDQRLRPGPCAPSGPWQQHLTEETPGPGASARADPTLPTWSSRRQGSGNEVSTVLERHDGVPVALPNPALSGQGRRLTPAPAAVATAAPIAVCVGGSRRNVAQGLRVDLRVDRHP